MQYAMSVDDLVTDPVELRAAIDAGMRITIGPGSGPASITSLDFLSPVIDRITDLRIGTVNRVVGATILQGARNLRSLAFAVGACAEKLDLAGLSKLEEFSGAVTRATASVLTNPSLRFLRVEGVIPKSFARVAGHVERFEHHGGRSGFALPSFQHPESLRWILRAGAAHFDLSQLEAISHLEEFQLSSCDDVVGLASLARLPRLTRLQLNGVTTHEDWADVPVVAARAFMNDLTPHPSPVVLATWRDANWLVPDEPLAAPAEALLLDEAGDGESWGVFMSRFDDLNEATDVVDGAVASGLDGELLILGVVAELHQQGVIFDLEADSESGLTAVYFSDLAQAEFVYRRALEVLDADTATKVAYLRAGKDVLDSSR